jgi:nitrogen fixation protein FixH
MRGRWHWGIGITLVYAIFASGTIGFVLFAMRQRVDLVSADYYPQSLAYDERMAAGARADALGDAFSVTVEPNLENVMVAWPPDMFVEAGQITLYRASDAGADRQYTVAPDGTGRQRIAAHGLERGAWAVRVDWTAGGKSFFAERRLMLP